MATKTKSSTKQDFKKLGFELLETSLPILLSFLMNRVSKIQVPDLEEAERIKKAASRSKD
jgi:hypothetical protein